MAGARRPHVVLIVENVPIARDHRLRKQAVSLVSAGYRVSVICRRDPANRFDPRIDVHDYRAPADGASKFGFAREYGYSLVMALWLMTRLFVRDRFDVIQISGTPDIYFLITGPFRLLGRRVVFDQRDLSPELYEIRYGRRDTMYDLLCRLERASYAAADQVIVVNESLADIARERGGVDSARMTVVGNGPELRTVPARRPAVTTGRYTCCLVGMMNPQDQILTAVRIAHELIRGRGRTDCDFVFIGDGDCREAAIELARDLGVAGHVSFPGWLPQERAFEHLARADVGIEPNLEPIVSPVKAMEYMAYGLPFVTFDLVETRRLAGGAAAYASPGDVAAFASRIDELLDDPQRRREMGREGRRRVREQLAWDLQQVRYLDIFADLTERRTA